MQDVVAGQPLRAQAAAGTGKLDGQDTGKKSRSRKLSDGGARACFYHEVCEAHLARIVRVDLKSELFTYTIDERVPAHARLMGGKLLLVNNGCIQDLCLDNQMWDPLSLRVVPPKAQIASAIGIRTALFDAQKYETTLLLVNKTSVEIQL